MKPIPPELLAERPGMWDEAAPEATIGRPPTKYTKALHEYIVSKVRVGVHPEVAAQSAGISIRMFNDWMKLGRDGNVHLAQFAEDIDKAEACIEVDMVEQITNPKSMHFDPKFFKERARAKRWSPKVTTIVTSELDAVVDRVRAEFADEPAVLVRILRCLAREE